MEDQIIELEHRIKTIELKMKKQEEKEKRRKIIRIILTIVSILLTLLCVITYYIILKHNIETIMGGIF